jgi:hypothetical protein
MNEPDQWSTVFASANSVAPPSAVKLIVSPVVLRTGMVEAEPPPATAVVAIVAATPMNPARASNSLRFIKLPSFDRVVPREKPLQFGGRST